jgi:hypothetical protein
MNISDLYSTRIQKTFDEDQAEIVSILKESVNKNFKLINYYKGMPLSYPATVTSVERGAVDFDTQAEQAFAIEQGRYTFIRSPLLKHDVFAEMQYVNVKKRAALFGKFSYVEIMAEHRSFIRLEPDPAVPVVIESALGIAEGKLFDVSLSGVRIAIERYYPLALDSEVTIRFQLANMEQTVQVKIEAPARLIRINDAASPYYYEFTVSIDKTVESALSKYIFQRQIEIIREIKDAV